MHRTACLTLLLCSAGALAQTVEITGSRDRARLMDTAAATVVGRDELLRFGGQTVADALKRVPGITIGGVQGSGGEIRMRGLGNGYTQVLLNGQPVPQGFSIDSISPELIERVEIMRVASAATGSQAIAGTVNIVLRKSAPRGQQEFKLGLAANNGALTPDASGQASIKGVGWSATMAAVATAARTLTSETDNELGFDSAGTLNLRRLTQVRQEDVRPTLNLTPRVSWSLPNGDTLVSQNFIRFLKLDLTTRSHDETALGDPTPFPDNVSFFHAHAETVRSDLQWLHQPEGGGRWDVRIGGNHFGRRGTNRFDGGTVVRIVDSSALEDNLTLDGKYSKAFDGGHALVAGWDAAHGRRSERRIELAADETSAAQVDRIALFAQDDWTVTPHFSLLGGLRWETIRIATGNAFDQVDRRATFPTPSLQALFKLSDQGQLRAGLSRTFKMPTLTNLAMRRYVVDNKNSALVVDTQGNPHLLPERAVGIDIAYERYFGKNAMASASAYARRIEDVIVDRVDQVGATWIGMPVNAGRAQVRGIELETKFPWRSFELRANLARNWSRVESVPGPDNRLANQPPLSASVGVDRALPGLPVTLGATFSFQGGGASRMSDRTFGWAGVQRDLGLVATWRLDAHTQWRLTGANLLGQDHLAQSRFEDGAGGLRTGITTPTWATIRLAFERKL
ncbi:TonB-dependent receptor [Massilia sp. R2A-15]|uniref:TonB-dependent receptor plug domain-containing protein n=1 Tax=Massilia sp. R2A-15 TaxID=3064278 RepID=UPI002733273D|nr:TonB-dependent receptor [Massilia sp. R2A-15]WLI91699.1 TonB-dependent receptor [Massilia sp. R2A-15]